jgi:anti-sigma factor RsiW
MNASIPEPTHREIQELLGVYALDALDRETAIIVELHLEGCPKCSTEVAHHHEVAGLLANSGGESPANLWDGIASQLEGSTPPSWERLSARLEAGSAGSDEMEGTEAEAATDRAVGAAADGSHPVPITSARSGARWVGWGAGIAAAAAAVVAIVLGVQVHHLDRQVNALQVPLSAAEQSALHSPSATRVQLTAPPGVPGAATDRVTLVLTKSGTGFVQAEHLSGLPAGQTYQLWGVIGRRTISLGLLGTHPTVVAFSVAGGVPPTAFAITAEHSGGVVQSTNQPVVAGQISA